MSIRLPPLLDRALEAFRRTRLGAGLGARGRFVAGAAALAIILCIAAPSPPERSTTGVAEILGRAVGGEVRADEYIWEERGGFIADQFWGRRVVFLAKTPGHFGRDLYRARVRLTRGGRALSVAGVHDLTRTPLDDDRDLNARRDRVAVLSVAQSGDVLGVRLFDLSGDGPAREAKTWGARFRANVESLLETDSTRGIGVTEISFDPPPRVARLELTDDALTLALGDAAEPAALDLRTIELNAGPKNPYGAAVQTLAHRVRPLSRWLGEIARPLGARFRDLVERIALRIGDIAKTFERAPPDVQWSSPAAESAGTGAWPPPPIAMPVARASLADGRWRPAAPPLAEGAAPYAFETAVLPAGSGGPLVRLIAFDTRQIDLGLSAGYDEPTPAAGPHALGRVPERGVVAVFNGAAPARQDESDRGIAIRGRVLSPIDKADAAGIAIDEHGSLRIGALADAPFFLRQTRALFLGSPKSPSARDCDDCKIERSALCVTKSGMVIYAWARDATADLLQSALVAADCASAAPLATRPSAVGLAFFDPPRETAAGRQDPPLRLVDASMSFGASSLATPFAEEIFYAKLRDTRPAAPLPAGATWAPDGATQPNPEWLPALHEATVVELGAQVHLVSFAPGRLSFRMRSGAKEIVSSKASAPLATRLDDAEQARALVAIGLGAGRRKSPRGLVVGGETGLPLKGDAGLLISDPASGAIKIAHSGDAIPAGADATELPLTADESKALPAARELGSMRARAAACVLDDGGLMVATTTFDSDEATTTALLDLGCSRVVALDRGVHLPAFVNRAGATAPLEPRYDATVLFAISEEMRGRAH